MGVGPENVYTGKGQEQLQTTDPSSRQKGCPTSTNLQLSDRNKNLVLSPKRVLQQQFTDLRKSQHPMLTELGGMLNRSESNCNSCPTEKLSCPFSQTHTWNPIRGSTLQTMIFIGQTAKTGTKRRQCRISYVRHPSHMRRPTSSLFRRSNRGPHTDWKHWNVTCGCL
jgi:hypothetical protein